MAEETIRKEKCCKCGHERNEGALTSGSSESARETLKTYRAEQAEYEEIDASIHFNSKDKLPPVGCPLKIALSDNVAVNAQRTAFVENKGDELAFELTDGTLITGRFPWTYP